MKNYFEIFEQIGLPILIVALASIYGGAKTLMRRWGTGSSRGWPTVSAVIDVVSVAEEIIEGRYGSVTTTGYKATLTYFYRNPELQMGEYAKTFPLEGAAKRWAEGFKGKTVLVHVNPKDPSDSVLLKNDLEGLGNGTQLNAEDLLHMEGLPQLKRGYLILSGISEFVALAGLALTATGVWMQKNRSTPEWLVTTLICLAVFNALSAWLVSYRADDSRRMQSMLRSYTLFCPAWMRWGVNITGGLLFAAWVIAEFHDLLPSTTQHALGIGLSYSSYLLAAWIFLSTGATHVAILRSQESVQRQVVAETAGIQGDS